MNSSLERHPEIADAYQLYQICRNQILYEFEFERAKKPMRLLLHYTTGLSTLPYEGGIVDQPERLMTFFEEFLAGDEQGFYWRLNNKK